jgi:hypothetical protein
MTAVTTTRVTEASQGIRWHRPLLWLAAGMVVLALITLVARLLESHLVTGVNQWDKPLKFALSTLVYAVTWSWLIGQMRRGHRLAAAAGTVITVALAIELAIITGAAAVGITSHFNVSTPLSTALWSVMATSISVLWIANFVVAVILLRNPVGDGARTLAIRLGAVISLVGLGLAFLMTAPTSHQLNDFQGIAGAHTVGLSDGGPGLPLLGWSTVAGDLRIPHFIGMHALQAIPLALIAAELLSRRIVLLRDVTTRKRVVWVLAAAYAGAVALVTWQALRGQSIVHPDGLTLLVGTGLLLTVIALMVVALRRGRSAAGPTPRRVERLP